MTKSHLLSVKEVATELNMSNKTVYKLIKDGYIRVIQLPNIMRIDPRELQRIKDSGFDG
tara:strand:- start:37 stop:213 length:177 start_codon:yes stop_codon:yes gene_type:complete